MEVLTESREKALIKAHLGKKEGIQDTKIQMLFCVSLESLNP